MAALRKAGTPDGYITWRMAMLYGIARGDDAYISDGVPDSLGPATPMHEALRPKEHASNSRSTS